ncbi:hypothetical protein HPB51_009507 [Rhipicephalus microplus]|uniref:Uncharacterized protein n=1 Tax=Rhipicephalus microplus TaxID=6941 RepID=A0A9J6DV30_RHIMP|nr:hypothetical protein HPB51_009507 [Rhipicephalus microplus]
MHNTGGTEFTSRRQLPGESFLEYVTLLKEKARTMQAWAHVRGTGPRSDYSRSSNLRVREKLLAYGEELSLEKAEEAGRTLEALSLANKHLLPVNQNMSKPLGKAPNMAARRERMAAPVGEAVTSRHQVRETQDGDFQPQSSSGYRAPVPNEKSQGGLPTSIVQPLWKQTTPLKFSKRSSPKSTLQYVQRLGHFASMCRKTGPVQHVSSRGAVDVVPEQQAST